MSVMKDLTSVNRTAQTHMGPMFARAILDTISLTMNSPAKVRTYTCA